MGQTQQNDRFANYVPVSERVEQFYQRFPEGRILTEIVNLDHETGFVLMKANVFRKADDADPAATGHAFEVRSESYVNKTSFIENCETSCVGRALALLGFEIKRGIASREEMRKTEPTAEQRPDPRPVEPQNVPGVTKGAPPKRDAKEVRDADIMGALDALGKDEEWLNAQMVKRWPQFKDIDWTDLGPSYKHDLWLGLNKMVNEKAQEAAR